MKKAFVMAFALAVLPATAATEDPEVVYLLDWVRASDCTFIRNGDSYPAPDAADHLAMKYRRARRWVDSADDFIDRIATGSSMSGDPYQVQCPGETRQPSALWLTSALQAHRQPLSSN